MDENQSSVISVDLNLRRKASQVIPRAEQNRPFDSLTQNPFENFPPLEGNLFSPNFPK